MDDAASILPQAAAPKRRGRKKRPPIIKAQLTGVANLEVLQPHLQRLRAAQDHPNRLLHLDNLLVALLYAFYNPTCRSLRTLEGLGKVGQDELGIEQLCRSTTSDALAAFDPDLLRPIIQDLRRRLPALGRADSDLEQITRQVIAADGSYFNLYADVAWAIHLTRRSGHGGAEMRLNLQLDVRDGTPTALSVSGDDGLHEADAFLPDLAHEAIYLADRNFIHFGFMSALLDKGNDFVLRVRRTAPAFRPQRPRPLTQADRDHGVSLDQDGTLTGRDAPQRTLREVTVVDLQTGESLTLITSLLDVPAYLVGILYRQRWQIELFFRWLKVWGNFEHLISHSRNGLRIQFYAAVIGVLLMYLSTGHRVSKYALSLLTFVAAGQATLEDILPILEKRERERQLERARLARKRAQKLGR